MIDPGRPFSVPFADVIASVQDRVRDGVDHPGQITFISKSAVSGYALPPNAYAVTRVSGLAGGQFRVFDPGVHYTFSGGRLVWVNTAERPDDGSRLTVDYLYREARSGITDFNEGSVAGTLIRAVAREIKLLYDQMDEAFRRGFVDQAEGVALDAVVALVGVTRKPAQPAVGLVTFSRKTPPPQTIRIPAGTRVADKAGRVFVTTDLATIPPADPLDELATPSGVVVGTAKPVAELLGVWAASADPGSSPPLPVKPGFGADGRSVTLDLAPAAVPAGPLRVRYRPRETTVGIEATRPGPDGNVDAGTITIMPTPPPGVDGATNPEPTHDGQDAEPDDRLRDRAKHSLERAGNATTNAIRFAVLEVPGVEGVQVIDRSVDESIPLGEVRVRYSGGSVEDVRRAVESSRAAGILVRLEGIVRVSVLGTFYLVPTDAATAPPAASVAAFLGRVRDAIKAIDIGAPLGVRRLNSLVFDLPGLADVAEAALRFQKPDPLHPGSVLAGDITDPFLVASNEVVRPDADGLKAVVLSALKVAGTQKSAALTVTLDVGLTDSAGNPVSFRSLSLDLGVVVRAYSLTNPDQPPERIARFTRAVKFAGGATAALEVTPADLSAFRPADHRPVVDFVLTAATYPGLHGVTIPVDVG